MQANIPTEEEVLGYFKSLSNWGRWGDDDQLGAPNLITPEKTKRAIATVQEGTTITLSRTVHFEASLDSPNPPVHFMVESGEGWASGDKVTSRPNAAATDYFGMIFHAFGSSEPRTVGVRRAWSWSSSPAETSSVSCVVAPSPWRPASI